MITILKLKFLNGKNKFFYTGTVKFFCEMKNHSDFAKSAFKNKKVEQNEDNSTKDNSTKNSSKKTQRNIYIDSKRIDLVKIYKNDLFYFKFEENFDINDLRKKYLELAKLYHPDLRSNDEYANMQFNKLQDSYERLKRFSDLRDEIQKLEKEGNYTIDLNDYERENLTRKSDTDSREEYIKQLCNI
jgi:hypothetical protein